MSEQKEKTETAILNHPYMTVLQEQVATQKRMYECLEKRLALMDQNAANKSEYEKNETEILRIKTIAEMDILKRVITEKENYFVKFMQNFIVEMEDMELNYENTIKKARPQIVSNEGIARLFKAIKQEVLETNIEVKLDFYKRIKALLK